MGNNSIYKTVKSQYPDITIIKELQTSETKLTYMLNWLTDEMEHTLPHLHEIAILVSQ